jgi:hypothetical protein
MQRRQLAAVLTAIAALAPAAPAAADTVKGSITNYTDPKQALQWGGRSHWAQPWRSYMDTVPATTLQNAIGVNFNVSAAQAPATAHLLAANGFRRARLEVGWNSLDYNDPTRLTTYARTNLETRLRALRDNGIRPLIVLNANHGEPTPTLRGTVTLTETARKGARSLKLDPDTMSSIVPGRTGITSGGVAARILFTSADADTGVVSLSRPLDRDLPAGDVSTVTLRYVPFAPPDDPRFQATLDGWLNYVGVVGRQVRDVLGSDDFDVEVWNELSFGSNFLRLESYYAPVPFKARTNEEHLNRILASTISYLRDPRNGLSHVGIGNGFANERPWDNGTQSPVGLTAIDKHPYHGWQPFPAGAPINGNRPLNGLGQPDGEQVIAPRCNCKQWAERFTPNYDSFFPEYFLSGIQTETLARDLSPTPSLIINTPHGRFTHPAGGTAPQMWVTEVNLGPGSGPTPRAQMSPADLRHLSAKNALRYFTAYVNKGVSALYMYGAQAGDLSIVDDSFFKAIKSDPTTYPGDDAGGDVTHAVRRLVAATDGTAPIMKPRQLSLQRLDDFSGAKQFEGNGTPQFPALFDRDVFAFLPFQINDHRFMISTYVMTRNIAKVYDSSSKSPSRFDLPDETYRMTIGGIDGPTASVSATDPLTGATVPVQIVSRGSGQVVVQMPVSDSPRLLFVDDSGTVSGAAPAAPEVKTTLDMPWAPWVIMPRLSCLATSHASFRFFPPSKTETLASVRVSVNGAAAKDVPYKSLVNDRLAVFGLPRKGTVKFTVTAKTTAGKQYSLTGSYPTC